MAVEAIKKPSNKASKKAKTDKQYTFVWEGTNKKGGKVKGEMQASSPALVKAQLRKQGVNTPKVKRKSSELFRPRKKPIVPADIAIVARQLATMMKAGVPLVQSLDIIGRGHDKVSVQELIMGVKANVESGTSFAESLRLNKKHFDDLFCDLVGAGEQSGALETMLDRIATYKEKIEALKSKIKKALFYPTAVIIAAIIVTSILLIFVVPTFKELFEGFGAALPAFTQFVINISEFVQAQWWIILLIVIGLVMTFKYSYKNSKGFHDFIDRMMIKMPIVGEILNKAAIARYARTLSTTFAAGVPLVEALESAAGASGNVVYYNTIMKIRDDVTTGMPMNIAMQTSGLFPNMVVQMVAIGEESGSVDGMLTKVADIYEMEVDDAVDALSSLLEPIIMAVLGVLVGGLIVAMYLPIFELGKVI